MRNLILGLAASACALFMIYSASVAYKAYNVFEAPAWLMVTLYLVWAGAFTRAGVDFVRALQAWALKRLIEWKP